MCVCVREKGRREKMCAFVRVDTWNAKTILSSDGIIFFSSKELINKST